jgi:hypothetical protein
MVCKDEMWKKGEDWGRKCSGEAKNDVGEETIEVRTEKEKRERVNLIKFMVKI